MSPLISIVTPSFNQAKFLDKTIRSVIEQNYKKIEYLIADGGSTDKSLKIIEKYKDHIDWWISEPDNGQADAINKGLTRVKGEIVAWINSDDFYLPGTFEKVIEFFENNQEIGMLYGDLLAVDQDGEKINHLTYTQYSLEDFMTFRIIGQPTVFFRRSVLNKVGLLDLDYNFLLDHQLWIRMACKTKIAYLPATLSAARYHQDAKNIFSADQFGKDAFKIVEWMRTNPETKDIFESIENRILAGAYLIDARYLLDGNKAWQSFKSYMKSFRYDFKTGLREWYRALYALIASTRLFRVENVVDRRKKINWFSKNGK